MRRFFRLFTRILAVFFTLVILLWVIIQLPPVQTAIIGVITKRLSEQTGHDISIGQVDVRFPLEMVFHKVDVVEPDGAILFKTEGLFLRALDIQLRTGTYFAHRVEVDGPVFNLTLLAGDSLTNLDRFLAHFPSSESEGDVDFFLETNEVVVRNGTFTYHDYNEPQELDVVDFNHLKLRKIDAHITALDLAGGDIDADIKLLRFEDAVSGFDLRHLHGHFTMRSDTLLLAGYSLRTPRTRLNGDLLFSFDQWSDFSDFNTKVNMRGFLDDAAVDLNDIAFFAPDLRGLDRVVKLSGRFRGPVANLKLRQLNVQIDTKTYLQGRLDLVGLPDIRTTFIDLSIDHFTTVKDELDRIPIPPFGQNITLSTPKNINKLGKVDFRGKFTGFLNDFVAFGTLSTAIGTVSSDIKLQESGDTYTYSGELKTNKFDLGKFYGSTDLGRLTSSLKLSGKGLTRDDMDASVRGRIQSVTLLGYTYRDIRANGRFKQNFFNGDLTISDQNIQLDFDGLIDFTQKKPQFDFFTSITHIDPVALNLVELRNYTSLSGDFRIQASGLTFNEINGSVIGDSVRFCTFTDEYSIEHLELFMDQDEETGKRFTLLSDIASGRLEGKFDFTGLASGVKQIVADIVPQIQPPPDHTRGREDFYLELMIHNFELVSQVFLPELEIASGSRFSLLMDDESGDFKTTFTTDRIAYEQIILDTLLVDISHPDASLYLTFQADRADFGMGLVFPDLVIDAYTEVDTVYTNLLWGADDGIIRGDVAFKTLVRGNKNITSEFNRLHVDFKQDRWSLMQPSMVSIDSNSYTIRDFFLAKGGEHIRIDGVISENPEDRLVLDLQGIELSMFNGFLEESGIEQDGLVTGTLQLRDVYNELLITTDLLAMDYTLNGYLVGDICVESSWDPIFRRLLLSGDLERKEIKQVAFSGFYTPNDDSPLNLVVTMTGLPMELANAFLGDGTAEITGRLNGRIEVSGVLADPQIEGEVRMSNATARIDYLNTTFSFSDRIIITPDLIYFAFPMRDQDDNVAQLAGGLVHHKYSDWNFDVFLDMSAMPFLLLNTTQEQNSSYFGKAYATGFASISGTPDDIEINVNARSERNTTIALPLGGSEDVTFEDFISFVDHSQTDIVERPVDLTGIRMNFELEVTPEAQFRIIFDEVVGDEIRGRGRGNIRMEINNLSDFNMFGNMNIEQGRYLFTLKNLINKEFEVRPGGSITWFGDPIAADIDIQALYRVNTSLFDLFPEESEQYKQRVPVYLLMNLYGKLMTPEIRFEINLPNSDELTRARVASVINNEQEINRQAFSLLVLRRFISPPDVARSNTSIGLAENSTELITSQLSNWLSQISDDFDIGVNYSPGDQISNEEIAVALSTQLFNDRLLVSGSFGVQQAQSSSAVANNPNNLIGDIRIEYKIHPQGKFRLIVYNQSNEFDLVRSRQNSYTQGMGVLYQQEFNDLYDLFGLNRPN